MQRNRTAVIITDFPEFYSKVVIGNLLKNLKVDVNIVEFGVKPFSILEAGWKLLFSYNYFPRGTIFAVIVDPDVGTSRKIIFSKGEYSFLAPDNGVLTGILTKLKLNVFEVHVHKFQNVSNTFHGRDVFAPFMASVFNNSYKMFLGSEVKPLLIHDFFPQYKMGKVYGRVVFIDEFGNAVTNITPIKNFHYIRLKKLKITKICKTFGYMPLNTPCVYIGSSETYEIGIKNGNFSKEYLIKSGDVVEAG